MTALATGAGSTKGTSVFKRNPLVPAQVQAREGLAQKPGDPSLKEPNLGLRNPTVKIPPTVVYNAATVVRTDARKTFAAKVSPHATWGRTWVTKKTSFIAAEGPAQYDSTLYMLGIYCEGLIIGAGGLNPMDTPPSTGGGDGRDGRGRCASGLTTASPRPLEQKLGVG